MRESFDDVSFARPHGRVAELFFLDLRRDR